MYIFAFVGTRPRPAHCKGMGVVSAAIRVLGVYKSEICCSIAVLWELSQKKTKGVGRSNARGKDSVQLSSWGTTPHIGPHCKGMGVVAAAGEVVGVYKSEIR